MPVRIRLTIIFVALVTFILCLVCGGIYYSSYNSRLDAIKKRLTNRALTTARLLAQKETFDKELVQKIDSLTTISLTNKTVQAYDQYNNKIYSYSDIPGDTLHITVEELNKARSNGSYTFEISDKEAVAFNYVESNPPLVVISAAEDKDGKQVLDNLLKILLGSFLVGNAFVLITGFIFSTRILRPIKKIAADVEDISAQNLTRRIKTGNTKDEWYNLADTLNRLLDRLQDSFELQRRFISNASHELSTPLTSISSQLQVALQKDRDSTEYKQVMQSINQDVQTMSKLTQTLLEFAKASGNSGGLDINLVRIDEILLSLPAEIAKINSQFSVRLNFGDLPEKEESLLVFGNELLLSMAIKNIVVNACKYSDDRHAGVNLKITETHVEINVSDSGKGIPETELDNIFQPFYRIDDNDKMGFGLGLSLALKIIILHKGSIHVISRVNVGTIFEIKLPKAHSLI